MDQIAAFAQGLQASPFGAWARGSSFAYPVANLVHLLGLIMLLGAIGVIDLRLAGVWRRVPVAPLAEALTPVGIAGLFLLLPSGLVMFAADAATLVRSPVYQVKLLLIALALINAVAFRWLWDKRLRSWDAAPPPLGRLMAGASLAIWLFVAALGRMIAYT